MDDNRIFYNHPRQKFCGDFIPFYDKGVFHLFTIIGSNWEHLTTTDFVNFENHGVALSGTPDVKAQDRDIYTGSVFSWKGVYHIFYCGHNEDLLAEGKPSEVVLHATSKDLFTWEKQSDVFLPPDESRFMRRGWRDPIVYRDEEKQEFRMLITGADARYWNKRWGLTALATSKDLKNWEIQAPLYAPGVYDAHECCDFFEINGKWYLVFSTFTRWWEVRYRVADTPYGPFRTPDNDVLDNRAFYAAKTVAAEGKRYLVGWAARRKEDKNDEKYEWGGALTVHELRANRDGTLALYPVESVKKTFSKAQKAAFFPGIGDGTGEKTEKGYRLTSDGYFCNFFFEPKSDDFLFTCDLTVKGAGGILFHADNEKFEKWASVEIDERKKRLFFDHSGKFFFDQMFDEERPLKKAAKYRLTLIKKDSVVLIYCNGVALTTRLYGFTGGKIGAFTLEGETCISNMKLKLLK